MGTGIAPRRWRLECSRPAAGRAIAGTSRPPSTWSGACCSCATRQSAPRRCSNALVGSSTTAVRATSSCGCFPISHAPRPRVDGVDAAGAHSARVAEIMDAGEDWRGRRAIVDVAAVVLSAGERPDEAEARFQGRSRRCATSSWLPRRPTPSSSGDSPWPRPATAREPRRNPRGRGRRLPPPRRGRGVAGTPATRRARTRGIGAP